MKLLNFAYVIMAVEHRRDEVVRFNRKAGCLSSGRWTTVCLAGYSSKVHAQECLSIYRYFGGNEIMWVFFSSWDKRGEMAK